MAEAAGLEHQQQQQQPQQPVATAADLLNGLPDYRSIGHDTSEGLWECSSFCGRPCIIKQCTGKPGKHPTLDRKLTGSRLKQEVRSMCRLRKIGILVPSPYYVDLDSNWLYMEQIPGNTLQQLLADDQQTSQPVCETLLAEIGGVLGKMHDSGTIHGNLSPANILIRNIDQAVALLDFSMSMPSTYPEDKGVDLFILEQALMTQHTDGPQLFDQILDAYKLHSKQWSATFNKLADVRARSRKKSKPGN